MPLRFEDPPAAPPTATSRYAYAVDVLRSRPGEWAIFDVKDSCRKAVMLAAQIREARLAVFAPRGAFQSVVRSESRREHRVYARWVGAS